MGDRGVAQASIHGNQDGRGATNFPNRDRRLFLTRAGTGGQAFAEVTAEEVRQAIDGAVAFLKRTQQNGAWPEKPGYRAE